MPEAEIGIEQLVDEMLDFFASTASNSSSQQKPWKVCKILHYLRSKTTLPYCGSPTFFTRLYTHAILSVYNLRSYLQVVQVPWLCSLRNTFL